MTEAEEQMQLDKFKALARKLEANVDEAAWDERLKKVVAQRPGPDITKEEGE